MQALQADWNSRARGGRWNRCRSSRVVDIDLEIASPGQPHAQLSGKCTLWLYILQNGGEIIALQQELSLCKDFQTTRVISDSNTNRLFRGCGAAHPVARD